MTAAEVPTVHFAPLERRGLLLGLSLGQLLLLAAAAVIAVLGVYSAGAVGLAVGAPAWVPLAVMATASVGGRPVSRWLPLVASWATRRRTGGTSMATRLSRTSTTSLDLPGVAGHLVVTTSPSLGAALVADRRTGTVTAIARVHGSGFVLDDPAAQTHKVATWGRVLSTLCRMPAVVRVQVVSRSVPTGSSAAREWWRRSADGSASFPARVVAELLDDIASTARRPETLIAVALRAPRAAGRGLTAPATEGVDRALAALADALAAADVTLERWADVHDLRATLRATYDPAGARAADASPPTRRDDAPPAGLPLVGAMAAQEHWTYLRTDSAVHATYWVTQWPRAEVHAGFLQPLTVSPTVTRTTTLVAEPLDTARALREIRRARAEHAADSERRVRIGQVEEQATRVELDELSRREAELVAGHGDLRFTGLVTVTATDEQELDAACAATETAAAQAMCEVRRLVGQQAQAHAAAAVPLARGVR